MSWIEKSKIPCYLLLIMVEMLTMAASGRPHTCEVDKYADGCSVPLGISAPYKEQFTPACNKHDICYGCVSSNGFALIFFHFCGTVFNNVVPRFDRPYHCSHKSA